MAEVEVGQQAPTFRLPSGHGGEVGPADYRGKSNLVVWFTKGMACPFCRTQMSQLARGLGRLKAAGAEVIQVTPTKPERARFYVKNFRIPFPYLCDPDLTRAPRVGARRALALAALVSAEVPGGLQDDDARSPRSATRRPSFDGAALRAQRHRQRRVRARSSGRRPLPELRRLHDASRGSRVMPSMDEILRPLQEAPAS